MVRTLSRVGRALPTHSLLSRCLSHLGSAPSDLDAFGVSASAPLTPFPHPNRHTPTAVPLLVKYSFTNEVLVECTTWRNYWKQFIISFQTGNWINMCVVWDHGIYYKLNRSSFPSTAKFTLTFSSSNSSLQTACLATMHTFNIYSSFAFTNTL